MKTKSLLFLLIGCYLLMTCDDGFLEVGMPVETEELPEEIVYPLKYTYTGVDFEPTEFYTYQIDSFAQITITEGDYALVDSFLFAELYDETNEESFQEWPFTEIELLNDTLIRMQIEVEDNPSIDTTFSYRTEAGLIIINFYGSEASFEIADDLNDI